jgi:hypothetical protein
MLIGKRFEKGKSLLHMSFYSKRRRLVGPPHDAVLGVAFVERCKLLRIPGIVQRLHQLQVLVWGHNLTFPLIRFACLIS